MYEPNSMVKITGKSTQYVSVGHITDLRAASRTSTQITTVDVGLLLIDMPLDDLAQLVRQAGGKLLRADEKGMPGYVMAHHIGRIAEDRKGNATIYFDGTTNTAGSIKTETPIGEILRELESLR